MSYERVKSLLEKGVSRPTLYNVRLPIGVAGVDGFTHEYAGILCVSVNLPETRTNTITANGHEYQGIVRDQPTHIVFAKPLTLTLVADRDYIAYKSLLNWFGETAAVGSPVGDDGGAPRVQRMEFHKNMTSDIRLDKLEFPEGSRTIRNESIGLGNYNQLYKTVISFNFLNCFPISIGAVSLGSDRTYSYATFDVDFMYESYHIETNPQNYSGIS